MQSDITSGKTKDKEVVTEITPLFKNDQSTVTDEIIKTKRPETDQLQPPAGTQHVLPEQDTQLLLPDSYDCSEVSIIANVTAGESCEDKPTGSLIVEKSSISGGTPPYEISIDNRATYWSPVPFEQP